MSNYVLYFVYYYIQYGVITTPGMPSVMQQGCRTLIKPTNLIDLTDSTKDRALLIGQKFLNFDPNFAIYLCFFTVCIFLLASRTYPDHQKRDALRKDKPRSLSISQPVTSGLTFALDSLLVDEELGFFFVETSHEASLVKTNPVGEIVQDDAQYNYPVNENFLTSPTAALLFTMLLL
ncbi:hypothetical protein BD560DRAFT_439347 [Blakeslea trispora]|nr:hypothetical protein BD560DRAFT_439347 [Blakeslea trispora]